MTLLEKIQTFIKYNNLIEPHTNIIVGLSGGPDSVFLLHILKKLIPNYNINIIAAHLDHQWRENSYKDIEFCKQLCNELEIPLITAKANFIYNDIVNEISEGSKIKKTKSLEEKGRLLRRAFFERLAKENNCKVIALAHHADDQQETFFIRLIRGSTITGLVSIRPKHGIYIRPLLSIYKSEILDYLNQNKINYLIDPTNESIDFLRNRIRKEVIPALRSCDDRFDINFSKTLDNIAQSEKFLENLTQELFNNISYIKDNKSYLDIEKLQKQDIFLQKRIILLWLCSYKISFNLSDNLLQEILRFFKNKKAKEHAISTSWLIAKSKNFAEINNI